MRIIAGLLILIFTILWVAVDGWARANNIPFVPRIIVIIIFTTGIISIFRKKAYGWAIAAAILSLLVGLFTGLLMLMANIPFVALVVFLLSILPLIFLIKRKEEFSVNTNKASTNKYIRIKNINISEKLHRFCWDNVYELAINYNLVLSRNIEYENCFYVVMSNLNVPSDTKNIIFHLAVSHLATHNVNYHNASPLNQFISVVPGYITYCLLNKLDDDTDILEAKALLDNPFFPEYLLNQIAVPISQMIKGALWRPNIINWVLWLIIIALIITMGYVIFKYLL